MRIDSAEREAEHARIDREVERRGQRAHRRRRRAEARAHRPGEHDAKRPARDREQHALRQELPDEAPAAGADGQPHGDLPLPRGRPRQQTGWRRSRTQSAGRRRRRTAGASRPARPARAVPARRRRPGYTGIGCGGLFGSSGLIDRGGDGPKRRLRPLLRDARLQAADREQPLVVRTFSRSGFMSPE